MERQISYKGGKVEISKLSVILHTNVLPNGVPSKKWTLKKLDKIRRSFLWKGSENANGVHCLVQWTKVQRPKQLGGLGVLDLELFGKALRLRWLWYQWTGPDRPWVGTEVPCDEVDKQLFRDSTIVMVGNGLRAGFWESSWLGGQAPRDLAPSLYNLAWRKHQSVKDDMYNNSWTRGLWKMDTTVEIADLCRFGLSSAKCS